MNAGAAARMLLAAACLGMWLPGAGLARAQAACSVDAGGFRAVVSEAGSGRLRLGGAPIGGRVQITGPGGICFLAMRGPEDRPPAPPALRRDDLVLGFLGQIRRAEIHGVEIDVAMPVPELSLGGMPLRLGWTQLRDEGRRYAADTLLDPATGAHVIGICALQDLNDAPLAEAFLRSVHLAPLPGLPECRP